MKITRVAILGSTGSIGRQTLEVIDEISGFSVCGLGAGSNVRELAEQAKKFRPDAAGVCQYDGDDAPEDFPEGVEFFSGEDAMERIVRQTNPDIVLTAVVGSAGIKPTLAAIECGSRLAIANKETLVCAGAVIIPAARQAGVEIIPVDSEHSAIYQCLFSGSSDEVRRVVITASGGALREWSDEQTLSATVDDALNHPTWDMGAKITVDSATMMNKALEVVEAHWLFDLSAEKIGVVIHPQSVVHSLVEFCDGSVIAQMAMPDMKGPIAYALCKGRRPQRDIPPLDLGKIGELTFTPPNKRFARAVELGYTAIRRGGSAGAVLNGANESAVDAFLNRRIKFGQIVPIVENVLKNSDIDDTITLAGLLDADKRAREEVEKIIKDFPHSNVCND